jgi:hypothetical protein
MLDVWGMQALAGTAMAMAGGPTPCAAGSPAAAARAPRRRGRVSWLSAGPGGRRAAFPLRSCARSFCARGKDAPGVACRGPGAAGSSLV